MNSSANYYQREGEEDEYDDLFDRLPDPIVLLIFNKLHDAKSLCLSMSVCKRFSSIIPEIDNVLISIPRCKPLKSKSKKSHVQKNVVTKALLRPLIFLVKLLKSKSSRCHSGDGYSFYMPHQVLNPFKHAESVEVKVPKMGSESVLLKWRAEFGSQLESCVIVGAKSISRNCSNFEDECDTSSQRESFIGDEELKLRVVWTISSMIAATTRHYLVHKMLNDQKKLQSLTVTDESNQGKLSMNHQQIREFRESWDSGPNEELLLDGTKVPTLWMKMWYVPELKLPQSRSVMEGATLVVVKPIREDGKGMKKGGNCTFTAAFDGNGEEDKLFAEAVRKLIKKKRSYTLEMNAF